MKTEVSNLIYFPDGHDGIFISSFKKIFPKENLRVVLWDFNTVKSGTGRYKMVLEINVEYNGGDSEKFTYTKSTTDMELIDKLKSDVHGVIKRKVIMQIVSNDTFIEELDEFLESIKPQEDGEYGD
jgi:hypothetical protein